MRGNGRTLLGKMRVAAGMIAMPVRIDDEARRALTGDFNDSALDQAAGIGQLIINQHRPVLADQEAEIAGNARGEHVQAIAQIGGFHARTFVLVGSKCGGAVGAGGGQGSSHAGYGETKTHECPLRSVRRQFAVVSSGYRGFFSAFIITIR